jgi:hypothetical protein
MNLRHRIFALAVVGGCAAAAAAPTPAGAVRVHCPKGKVKNLQGVFGIPSCAPAPPKGQPAPGYWKVSNANLIVGLEVIYSNKAYRVKTKVTYLGTAFTCPPGATFSASPKVKYDQTTFKNRAWKGAKTGSSFSAKASTSGVITVDATKTFPAGGPLAGCTSTQQLTGKLTFAQRQDAS